MSLADTWVCHVCGEERPDKMIDVHTEEQPRPFGSMKVHVRYCKDNRRCAEGAPIVAADWLESWRGKR